MNWKSLLRRCIPFSLRASWHRQCRRRHDRQNPLPWAATVDRDGAYPHELVRKSSPLQRGSADEAISSFSAEKKTNLRLAAAKLDGLVIAPNEVFSFCRLIGPTTRSRGFQAALEMHDGVMSAHVGGGLCQMANLLFHLAVMSDAVILERHRHGFDLFPDTARSMPFGYGATVFFNYVDFRWRNRLPFPIRLSVEVGETEVTAIICAQQPMPYEVKVVESDHAFYRKNGAVWRRNKLWRETTADGVTKRELLFENDARTLYPADHLVIENC